MPKIKSREKTTEQLEEDLRKIKEELAIQKWGLKKTLKGMKSLVKELIQKKKEVEEAKAKNEALLESIGEGVAAVDVQGKILFVNHVFEELLGWKQNEVVGKPMAEVILYEDETGNRVPFKERILSQVLAGKKVTTTPPVFYFVRKNKTRFPVNIVATPVIIDNKIVGAIEIFREITKEKKIEKMRLDFLALASHQLRTPLSGTKWLIETMQRGVLGKMTPRQKDYLNQLYGINERMIKLVSDMLNALRLESGVVSVKKDEISVLKLYDDIIFVAKVVAKEKGWIVIRNLLKNKKDVRIETDVQILRNILECFVSNAINYSTSGKAVDLDVREEKAFVIFSVKDNGIGIPKEEQGHIFERFYRASNAKKVKPDGTGLGLYTASMLAEKIGGKTSFESEEGKGTTFYLRVPK